MVAIFALFLLLLKGVVALAVFAFWLWMLVHAITNTGLATGEKVAWVLAIIFLPCIGAIIYFFVGRPKGNGAIG